MGNRKRGKAVLETILNIIVHALHAHGFVHPNVGAVNHVLGWVTTNHWIIRVCKIGSHGCHL